MKFKVGDAVLIKDLEKCEDVNPGIVPEMYKFSKDIFIIAKVNSNSKSIYLKYCSTTQRKKYSKLLTDPMDSIEEWAFSAKWLIPASKASKILFGDKNVNKYANS